MEPPYKGVEFEKLHKKRFSLRHSCSLQGSVFCAAPRSLQSFPPLDGGGLVQVLVSVFVPPPQVALQLEVVSHTE